MGPYAFFFAGLFLALGVTLGLGVGAEADLTGACLLTAAFLPLAASFTGVGAEGASGAAVPFADLAPIACAFAGVFGANFEPFAPLRPHLPRSGAAASSARHSSNVRLFWSLSFWIFAVCALSVM